MAQLTKSELETYEDELLQNMCRDMGYPMRIPREGMINLIMIKERMTSKILQRIEYKKKLKNGSTKYDGKSTMFNMSFPNGNSHKELQNEM